MKDKDIIIDVDNQAQTYLIKHEQIEQKEYTSDTPAPIERIEFNHKLDLDEIKESEDENNTDNTKDGNNEDSVIYEIDKE